MFLIIFIDKTDPSDPLQRENYRIYALDLLLLLLLLLLSLLLSSLLLLLLLLKLYSNEVDLDFYISHKLIDYLFTPLKKIIRIKYIYVY